jgi:hypothetical protein
LYYGVHFGDYKDNEQFLGNRKCVTPIFHYVNNQSSYLGAFFTINHGRKFGGVVRIINEYIRTLIEGRFSVSSFQDIPYEKFIPSGSMNLRAHEHSVPNRLKYTYEDQEINVRKRFDKRLSSSPWLYNSCNRTMATISNYCSIDPSLDMQYKEFFYIVKEDIMLGNIYCKKSFDDKWKRIATMELIRTR